MSVRPARDWGHRGDRLVGHGGLVVLPRLGGLVLPTRHATGRRALEIRRGVLVRRDRLLLLRGPGRADGRALGGGHAAGVPRQREGAARARSGNRPVPARARLRPLPRAAPRPTALASRVRGRPAASVVRTRGRDRGRAARLRRPLGARRTARGRAARPVVAGRRDPRGWS